MVKKKTSAKKTSKLSKVGALSKAGVLSKTGAKLKKSVTEQSSTNNTDLVIDSYEFRSERIPLTVTIVKKSGEFVPTYSLQISAISKTTEMILEKVRMELIRRVSLGSEDIGNVKKTDVIEDKFNELIGILIDKYFPDSDADTTG